MPDLVAELLRRNARLRAWRAYGVPVEGGWERVNSEVLEVGDVILSLRCLACGESGWDARLPPESIAVVDAGTVRRMVIRGCSHFIPLLDPDPPEVQAITELEILAGDGGLSG